MSDKRIKLERGKIVLAEAGNRLYTYRDEVHEGEVYYIIAGMLRLEYTLPDGRHLKYYLQTGSLLGLAESVEGRIRISSAVAIEKTMLYKWNLENFFLAADETRQLALITIKSLSRQLRILNAEYVEQLKINKKIKFTSEETRLNGIDLDLDNAFNLGDHQNLRQIFNDRQVLIKEGEIQRRVFWILNGEVYVTKYIDKKYKIFAKLGKGELIGEMSFFDKSLTSATVIANGEVQAMAFTLQDFKEIFFTNPKWIKTLLLSLSRRTILMVKKFNILND